MSKGLESMHIGRAYLFSNFAPKRFPDVYVALLRSMQKDTQKKLREENALILLIVIKLIEKKNSFELEDEITYEQIILSYNI